MDNGTPLVSVIIPTYNRPEYLKLTLQSVLTQTYTNIEVIVVDDGTPNDLNKELCSLYENVNYYKIENSGGPCLPRNIGIQKAKGEYLAFVDDDDTWLVNKIEIQVKILEENREFGLVHCCCIVINEKSIETGEIVGRPGSNSIKHGSVYMRMIGNWTVMMPTPLVRKTIVDKVGFFKIEMPQTAADVEYWSRCSFYTKFYYLNQPLVNYRVHSENMSIDKENYLSLPLHLLNVVKNGLHKKLINPKEFLELRNNLLYMQAKMIRVNHKIVLSNLFKINACWFFNIRIHKIIIKRMFVMKK